MANEETQQAIETFLEYWLKHIGWLAEFIDAKPFGTLKQSSSWWIPTEGPRNKGIKEIKNFEMSLYFDCLL